MTSPTPETVDLERLEKVAIESAAARKRAGVATGIYWQSNERRAYERAFTEKAVLALLSRLRAADQRAERMLCEACGTITRDAECDCTRTDLADRQRLVNYADAMANSAAELAAQNAVLASALQGLMKQHGRTLAEFECGEVWAVTPEIITARTALATTPAEALAVVREMQAKLDEIYELGHGCMDEAEYGFKYEPPIADLTHDDLFNIYDDGFSLAMGRMASIAKAAIDAARRVFGQAARGEAG